MNQNRIPEAEAVLESLKHDHPNHPEVLAQEGMLAYHNKKFAKATKMLQKAFDKAPTSQLARQLSKTEWRQGMRRKSLTRMNDWLAKNPNDLAAQRLLGDFYLAEKNHPKAIQLYRDILKNHPDDIIALNNLAVLLTDIAPDNARKYAEKAFRKAPHSAQVIETLAIILLEKRDTKRALHLLRQASALAPNSADIRYQLARALIATNRKSEAQQMLKELLKQQPQFAKRQAAEALYRNLLN